jgi:hypothetical protein
MITEKSTRLNHALDRHRLVKGTPFSSVRAIKLMWRMKGSTVKLSATDKLTRIMLDAVRRLGNL